MYTVQGLWTQARENLNVLTVILSNRAYAILEIELKALGVNQIGRNASRMMSLDDPPIDWVLMAKGMGVEATRADTVERFEQLLSAAFHRDGPFLIECLLQFFEGLLIRPRGLTGKAAPWLRLDPSVPRSNCIDLNGGGEASMPPTVNQGVAINYELEGDGPLLVLCHGSFGSLEDWYDFGYVDGLKDTRTLVLIDARGHGKSDKPLDTGSYSLASRASDITAVLDALGIETADYLGYSMGGWIGFGLALYAKDRFRSLMLGGATPSAKTCMRSEKWCQTIRTTSRHVWSPPMVFTSGQRCALGLRRTMSQPSAPSCWTVKTSLPLSRP